jgi:hypothetical protein
MRGVCSKGRSFLLLRFGGFVCRTDAFFEGGLQPERLFVLLEEIGEGLVSELLKAATAVTHTLRWLPSLDIKLNSPAACRRRFRLHV